MEERAQGVAEGPRKKRRFFTEEESSSEEAQAQIKTPKEPLTPPDTSPPDMATADTKTPVKPDRDPFWDYLGIMLDRTITPEFEQALFLASGGDLNKAVSLVSDPKSWWNVQKVEEHLDKAQIGASAQEGTAARSETARSRSKTPDSCSPKLEASSTGSQDGSEALISKLGKHGRAFIGEFIAIGWASSKSRGLIKPGDSVNLVRETHHIDKKKRMFANRPVKENTIVRFYTNSYSFPQEIGRLPSEVAQFVSKMLDLDVCQFDASVVFANDVLSTGDDVILQLRCYLNVSAFSSIQDDVIPASALKKLGLSQLSDSKAIFQKAAETEIERLARERKWALLQLFKILGLKPVNQSEEQQDFKANIDTILAEADKEDSKSGQADEADSAESEEKQVTDKDLDALYEKAQHGDAQLPMKEPPPTMTLELRDYQKQALAWMYSKEMSLDGDVRKSHALHPLWDEYKFAKEPDKINSQELGSFYFNPYSGSLTVDFPAANTQCKGGILADEMGLGKTIEILSLILTNRPDRRNLPTDLPPRSSPTNLIVCPMSLLAQWRDECIRGSQSGLLNVEVYYGGLRDSNIVHRCQRWDGTAPDVLITSYGTLMSEWSSMVESEEKGYTDPWQQTARPSEARKAERKGLLGIHFWRVVLDEAHHIKGRTTKTAKACYAVEATRRWVVTGTPIQNKPEDLFSLVHFLRSEPWSNFTFWRLFITVPFENKDPKAFSVLQTVLEPLLLRRTKAMKDANGNPLVPLPKRTIDIEYLDFSDQEKDIYEALWSDSKTKFSHFCVAGSILSNYASIFQLLMRLRQVCDHPYLVLGHKTKTNEEAVMKDGPVDIQELLAKFAGEGREDSYGANVLKRLLQDESGSGAEQKEDDLSTRECAICFENVDSAVLMPCMHIACRACVVDYLQKKEDQGEQGECPICRHGPITEANLIEVVRPNGQAGGDKDSTSATSRLRRNVFKSSTKLDALIKELEATRKTSRSTKSVVFSQFTSFLDLVETALERNNFSFVRLDGTMSQDAREKVLKQFSTGNATVMLISLRAGGVGLNLDPWWNYAVEAQAIDRVHRLGQKQEVIVKRYIIRGSVEEKILAIQNRKNALASGLGISKDEARAQRVEELHILFGNKPV
ncbi:hypothetical protein BZG36_00582 [Bifiguratus adelaidae]|uniref:DNA repair protein RAD5 n=1 Tax=Bifiguratus adelaidae TaxID=1938954 RepID=A0A261Y7D6_9FUNG|nr:hypothetical protein BZG36_00582 [Bifiguratus adelaidae]